MPRVSWPLAGGSLLHDMPPLVRRSRYTWPGSAAVSITVRPVITTECIDDLPDTVPAVLIDILREFAKIEPQLCAEPWGEMGGVLMRHKMVDGRLRINATLLCDDNVTRPLLDELNRFLYTRTPVATPGNHVGTAVLVEGGKTTEEGHRRLQGMRGAALEAEFKRQVESGHAIEERSFMGVLSESGWRYRYRRIRDWDGVTITVYEPSDLMPRAPEWKALIALDAKLLTRG